MCEQCLTDPVYLGEVLPGWTLARARRQGDDWNIGEWGLIKINDPSFTWKITPTPNPAWGMADDEEEKWSKSIDKESDEYRRWNTLAPIEFVEAFDCCGPNDGYQLIKAAIEVGYKPDNHGFFAYWFFDYIGEYLKTAIEDTDEEVCFPEREKIYPIDLTINKTVHPSEPSWIE